MLVQISIPYFDGILNRLDYKNIYFQCELSPTQNQVISYLQEMYEIDKNSNWLECMATVLSVKSWKGVNSVLKNVKSFVTFDEYRSNIWPNESPNLAISWDLITPKQL